MGWIQARTMKSGKVRYRAYWRDPSRKTHAKVFARKRDAEAHGRLMERWKRRPRVGGWSLGSAE